MPLKESVAIFICFKEFNIAFNVEINTEIIVFGHFREYKVIFKS